MRPTPLILRYGEGDWNALHQDLYGDVYFPFQVVTVLTDEDEQVEYGFDELDELAHAYAVTIHKSQGSE